MNWNDGDEALAISESADGSSLDNAGGGLKPEGSADVANIMQGGVTRAFARYVSLNVMGMVALSAYILADTFFIAQGVGPAGLAALNFCIVPYTLMKATGLMIGIGSATEFQVRKSRGDAAGANRVFTTALMLVVAAAILYEAGVQGFAPQLSTLLGAREDTFVLTVEYLRTIFVFAPLFLLNDLILPFVRNDDAPQIAMAAMVTSSLANIFGDWLFVFAFGWGMFGAAFATGLSPLISLGILSVHFLRKKNTFRPIRTSLRARLAGTILVLGFSSFLVEAASGVVMLALNLIILEFAGTTGVAAYGVVANFAFVAAAMFTGVSQGLQPLASNAYARGNANDVRAVLKLAVLTALVIALVIYVLVYAFSEPLAMAFNRDRDPVLNQMAVVGMRIYFVGFFFAGVNMVVSAYFSAVELPSRGLAISVIRALPAILLCVFVLAALFGMTGVWSAFPAAEALTCVFTVSFVTLFLRSLKSGAQRVRF